MPDHSISFDCSLQRIEVGVVGRAKSDDPFYYHLTADPNGPDGAAAVIAHVFEQNDDVFGQALAVAFLHPKSSDAGTELYSTSELEIWTKSTGAEVLWDLCRRAMNSLAAQMDAYFDFDGEPPEYRFEFRSTQDQPSPASLPEATVGK